MGVGLGAGLLAAFAADFGSRAAGFRIGVFVDGAGELRATVLGGGDFTAVAFLALLTMAGLAFCFNDEVGVGLCFWF